MPFAEPADKAEDTWLVVAGVSRDTDRGDLAATSPSEPVAQRAE